LVGECFKLLLGQLLHSPGDNEPVLVGGGDQLDVLQIGWLGDLILVDQTKPISNLQLW